MAFQTRDVLDAMQKDAGIQLAELKVDGGASVNDLLMQFQADMLGVRVLPARGGRDDGPGRGLFGRAGGRLLARAGRHRGQLVARLRVPAGDAARKRDARYARWQDAVSRAKGWAKREG